MSQSWKKLDLEGAGLQHVNIVLARRLKKRPAAYGLWLLFPLGAHRFYLEERIGASVYGALSALALILWLTLHTRYALAPLLAALAFAVYDLLWIDRRLVALNKKIRMNLYLRAGAAPPPGYRGRYTDDQAQDLIDDYIVVKESERPGVQPVRPDTPDHGGKKRAPSFAEQEAMLRELAKKPGKPSGKS